MTGTAELIALARLESIDEDGNITDQVKYDLARTLAAQVQEIERLKKAEHQLLIMADQRQGRYEAAEARVKELESLLEKVDVDLR